MDLSVKLEDGDGDKQYATVTIGGYKVIVYEYLSESGEIIVEVDGKPESYIRIYVNDGQVF